MIVVEVPGHNRHVDMMTAHVMIGEMTMALLSVYQDIPETVETTHSTPLRQAQGLVMISCQAAVEETCLKWVLLDLRLWIQTMEDCLKILALAQASHLTAA